ncbi:MAG: hypothetical protein M1826_006708 [Phylliscum demangeonii]|nr:MAG: hypothetical protein M1826_006708 [Phylliscum demangeonii]
MKRLSLSTSALRWLTLLASFPALCAAGDVLQTNGFVSCATSADIVVHNVNVQFNRSDSTVTFDVSGSSAKPQNVTASLTVTAYGKQVYQKDFDPCDASTKVARLCPVPAGNFSAKGSQVIPANYAHMIPDIAFSLPDLDGEAKLELKTVGGAKDLACIESSVNNGKTAEVHAVSYVAAGVTGAALVLSGLSAISIATAGSAAAPGMAAPSPGFGAVLGWLQSIAVNGMLSVNYPPVYRSFSRNFGFAGGLIPWNQMQSSIDGFRKSTGGNLAEDSVTYLQNATLVYQTSSSSGGKVAKRDLDGLAKMMALAVREVSTSVNGSTSTVNGLAGSKNNTSADDPNANKVSHLVHGIQGYAEQLLIPKSNIFLTVLLVLGVVIAAITVGILLFKVILELWALCASFPKALTGFRKRYWGFLGRTIVNLILILYGIWTLYCVYQFTHGDSWAAKALAGVTLGLFTAILGFFIFRIWQLARRYKQAEGDTSALFENKDTWRRYSLFYDQYQKGLWWIFIPTIIYMFAKGCIIAAADGHGLVQTIGQLVVETLMLALLLWHRPYVTKAGNWINVFIQLVRVLSVVCILVFVEELGVAQSTKTVTGVVLIAMQSALTGALAILIAVNAIIICCRENPHRRQRKAAEKLNRDLDNLTALDPRNSMLMEPPSFRKEPLTMVASYGSEHSFVGAGPDHQAFSYPRYRDELGYDGARSDHQREHSRERLVGSAAAMPYTHMLPHERSGSPESDRAVQPLARQPTVPNIVF